MTKKRLLTGDTPTGRLHLGHWVGSLENRVHLQDEYECFFVIANLHAFTTRSDRPQEIHQSVVDIMMDYLSVGIDPIKSVIFLESEIPVIYELTFLLSMLIPFQRIVRNPTIKDEIRDKDLGTHYSFGFLSYVIAQAADILCFRPDLVPVGEDQLPHLELTREVARKFNQIYCGVSSHTEDKDYLKAGGVFPIIEPKVGRVKRFVGLNGPNDQGQLLKMSKSLNNAVFLSDDADTLKKKIMGMYTDPQRLKATDPGKIENNPLWIFHESFNPDLNWVEEAKDKYRSGQIGDVECKRKLIDVLEAFIKPIRERRREFEADPKAVLNMLKQGCEKANTIAEETFKQVKEKIDQRFF